ncbi:MAG: hypothetical protein NC548_06410 [Lachnospiraceae bacterium]|nr:hypothetical protein [Lachnospiraceae bacterium]
MVYILSKKFFGKNVDRLVAPNRYLIIDGENYSVTSSIGDSEKTADNYSNAIILGGFCPENALFTLLRRKKKGEDFSEKKLKQYTKDFLKSRDFTSAACLAMKAQAAYGDDNDCNIFIVVPNLVNKYLSKVIKKRMLKIIRYEGDKQFLYTQKEAEEIGKKIFSKTASRKTLREVLKGIGAAEKRYKLDDASEDKDDDDDWI